MSDGTSNSAAGTASLSGGTPGTPTTGSRAVPTPTPPDTPNTIMRKDEEFARALHEQEVWSGLCEWLGPRCADSQRAHRILMSE